MKRIAGIYLIAQLAGAILLSIFAIVYMFRWLMVGQVLGAIIFGAIFRICFSVLLRSSVRELRAYNARESKS